MLMLVQKITTMMESCLFVRILRNWPLREWQTSYCFDTVLTGLYVMHHLVMATSCQWCREVLAC